MWALTNEQRLINREFCINSVNSVKKWQYQDNYFSLPNGVKVDEENVLGDFILEISRLGDGK